jgi:precorrin-6Y C5,15-methyltransferase (decarboxylating) CbiT subunit
VFEDLGGRKERITKGGLRGISGKGFSRLNTLILLREGSKKGIVKGFGLRDSLFSHSKGMITKSEVRAISLSRLCIRPDSIVWDIGSGSGSVAVEASMLARHGKVFAFEKKASQIRHITRNKESFSARNLFIVKGTAPECIMENSVESPDAIFIGGGGSGIKDILRYSFKRLKKGGAVVINAISIETHCLALKSLKENGFKGIEMIQANISRLGPIASAKGLNILRSNNPIFIISGRK